jgi:hypothetical protein
MNIATRVLGGKAAAATDIEWSGKKSWWQAGSEIVSKKRELISRKAERAILLIFNRLFRGQGSGKLVSGMG